jgi:hypothetical protein
MSDFDFSSILPQDIKVHSVRMDKSYRDTVDDRVLIILRSLPGSDSSVLARCLGKQAFADETDSGGVRSFALISTDDWFPRTKEGKVKFDHSRLREYQNFNYDRAVQLFVAKVNMVVLDNFNVRRSHFNYYANTAKTFGYTIIEACVGPTHPTELEIAQLSIKSNMSSHTIANMARDWED